MIKQAREWWNKHAIAYQKDTNIPIDIHYGPGSPNEDELQLVGDVKAKHVLEIGCGGAQCSIAFAKKSIDDLSGCFKEVYRVLKDDGIFVWSVGHPFHDIVDPKTLQLRESYFDTGIKIEGAETDSPFANVFRTVSDYFNIATEADFMVEKMIEPDSRKHYQYDPWYGLWEYSPELSQKVPNTLIFKCRKK